MTAPALFAAGVTKRFGDDVAVDGIDLTVDSGEIHAIVGLNGAGKTTLMRMFLGMVRADSGRIEVLERDVQSAQATTWGRVGHVIETPFAYPELTVEQNLKAAALLHGVKRGQIDVRIDDAVERFGLAPWRGKKSRVLSLGNKQRLGIASAVLHDPQVVIFDEPANSLDPSGVVFVRELLTDMARSGVAVLVSSHHFDQLARIADRVTVLHRGRIVGTLDVEQLDLESRFFDLIYAADQKTPGDQ